MSDDVSNAPPDGNEPSAAPAPTPEPASTAATAPPIEDEGPTYEDEIGVLGQSVTGEMFTDPRHGRQNYETARENGFAFEKSQRDWAREWGVLANESADMRGEIMTRLAKGELPNGPPSMYANDIAAIRQQHQARREIRRLEQETPPGHPNYTSPQHQSRLQALYALSDDGGDIVGRGGRTL